MKIRDIVEERINWNALRQAKAVMPYLYDSPEARKAGERPNPNEPNIITSVNLKQAPRPGDRLTPLPQMSPAAWQRYMDGWWRNSKTDPDAKEKVAQIKQAAADAKMPIQEFIIMPHTADTMGLIHRPGVGPNNRFDFKNKGNNKANEKAPPGREKQVKALKGKVDNPYAVAWASYNKSKNEEAAGVGIVTKQNATKDVPVGGQYMNVKKLKLDWKEFNENFADGKKKGKSRPGRVKRSGASCNGSVTALRKRAKNSSGEKAKMYHWCANMKSGRKKK